MRRRQPALGSPLHTDAIILETDHSFQVATVLYWCAPRISLFFYLSHLSNHAKIEKYVGIFTYDLEGAFCSMDYYENQNHPEGNVRPPASKNNSFATAALVFGILSLITAIGGTVYPPFLCASLGILLAVLSKGNSSKMETYAKGGFILSLIGLVVNAAIIFSTVYLFVTVPEFREQMHDQLNTTSELFYGQDFDSLLEDAGYHFPFAEENDDKKTPERQN